MYLIKTLREVNEINPIKNNFLLLLLLCLKKCSHIYCTRGWHNVIF